MSHRRGFSLLEVLVALAVLVALSGATYAFLFELVRTRTEIRQRAARDGASLVIFDRLERALATCTVAADGEPGIQGDASALNLAATRVTPDPAGDNQVSRRASLHLSWEEQTNAIKGGSSEREAGPIARSIERLRFRYHDGDGWNQSFNSLERGELPRAIEISIWFGAFDEASRDEAQAEPDQFAAPEQPNEVAGITEAAIPRGPSELEQRDQPQRTPDVYRVIAIPDAAFNGADQGAAS